MKLIASMSVQDFVEAALHETAPCTSESLATVGNLKFRTALRHLELSTATLPLTDGIKMHLHRLGNTMQRIFDPLCVKLCPWSTWKALLGKEPMPENDGAGDPPCRHPASTRANAHIVEITKLNAMETTKPQSGCLAANSRRISIEEVSEQLVGATGNR